MSSQSFTYATCCVVCGRRGERRNYVAFTNRAEARMLWMRALCHDELSRSQLYNRLNALLPKDRFICKNHFYRKDFLENGRLNAKAIPRQRAIEVHKRIIISSPPESTVLSLTVPNLLSEQDSVNGPAVHACDLFPTEVKKEQEDCEASTSLLPPEKGERNEGLSKAFDGKDDSETCCESYKPTKDVDTKTEEPVMRVKDGRCGTSTCACCQFYQNELKKMAEHLQNLQRNWNKTES